MDTTIMMRITTTAMGTITIAQAAAIIPATEDIWKAAAVFSVTRQMAI